MDNRDSQELYKKILKQIVSNMDGASSIDCFHIAVSLSKNVISFESIPQDLFYTLYLNSVRYIDDYNLSDLSYFFMLFSTPYVQEQIPRDFWTKTVEPQLLKALEDYTKYKENINIELFLDDYIRCFMALSMTSLASEDIWDATSKIISRDLSHLNAHTIQNFIYCLVRNRIRNQESWDKIVFIAVEK